MTPRTTPPARPKGTQAQITPRACQNKRILREIARYCKTGGCTRFSVIWGGGAAKVRDFGSNMLKCSREQIWAPNLLKSAIWPLAPSNVLKSACQMAVCGSQRRSSLHKKVFAPRADQICSSGASLGAGGGVNVSAKVAPTPYVLDPPGGDGCAHSILSQRRAAVIVSNIYKNARLT